MRVVIANPPWPGEGYGARTNVRWPHRRGDKVFAFPIYLAYASSILKQNGFEVLAIDAEQKELGIDSFVKRIREFNPNVIFLEISAPSLIYDLETGKKIKKELPNARLVFGGAYLHYGHEDLIENYNFIDFCIRKEFEYVLRDLCIALDKKLPLEKVRGITHRKNNRVVINPDQELIGNLDEMPYPDREGFRIEDYQQAFFSGKKTASMISSRGCPFQCSFCVWPQTMYGHRYRARSPKSVVDEIEYLQKNYKADEIFFDDDTFALSRDRIQDISREIIRRNLQIKWLCMGRVNTVDEYTLKLMKKAGCTQVFYGFESGSQKILDSISKGITKQQMVNAVKLTKKAGMVASGSFIIGLPGDSKGTVKDTIDFAKKLKADFVQFTLAAPFPGTKFFEEARQKNLLEMESLSDLDGTHGPIIRTENLSKEELAGIIRKAYISYYTSPGIIWQSVKRVKNPRDARRIFRGLKSVVARIVYYKK